MSSYQKDREEFIAVIVAEVKVQAGSDAKGVELAKLLLRNAARLQTLAEAACNRELTESEERIDAQCERWIIAACTPWGIKPTFSGDPRGAVVKLLLPSGRWNSFGGAECGFCVPTR